MFSILSIHKKLSYIDNKKCFYPYYIDDWNYYFERCIDSNSYIIKFNL
jgi:hypothetical protein